MPAIGGKFTAEVICPTFDDRLDRATKELQAMIPDMRPGERMVIERYDGSDGFAIFKVTKTEFGR
jgi:hypothetical protein